MRDYEDVLKQAKTCANRKYCSIGGNCEYYDLDVCCQDGEKDILKDAADAIEELLSELEEYKRSDKLAVKTIYSMAEQLASAPRWISVEDELPEEVPVDDERWSISVRPSADVNIYLPSEGAIVTAFYSWADGTWITVNEDRIYYASEVSHWSKLPAPPKGVE